ncbi:RNA polymerase sigma factor [Aquimarina sediminis]|uniref:RNA polymerase sigma factor n=1 Tax=Aquimarina sediminis TaxID=2070536 RepID=UPI000CA02CF1|nr:RNA polymerase sigma factor [Aquimarina sediminis]
MIHKDRVIITGIIDGDEQILNCFYKENIRYIQGYILHNCGNPEDVEDVFQDALMLLYQKLGSGLLELKVPVKTYFFGICKNLWRNRLRRKQKMMIDEKQDCFDQGTNDPVIANIENQEREHLYKKHFQRLSPDNKKVLYLFLEGRSMKEISKITGYSEGYTRKKKFEAKNQLLRMIEQDPMYEELRAMC